MTCTREDEMAWGCGTRGGEKRLWDLVWKLEGKRAPHVYQLGCHIVWRRTEFRPTAVEAGFSPSTPASVYCSDL